MSLSFESNNNGFAKNAFCSEVSVKGAKNVSGEPTPWGTSRDLAIELDLAISGKDFIVKQTLGGNFKKDKDGKISDWGAAFPIRQFIDDSGYLDLLDKNEKENFVLLLEDGKIPQSFIDYINDKTLYRISYVKGLKPDGKLHWVPFSQLFFEEQKAKDTFVEQTTKGYPKNYDPLAVAISAPVEDDVM